jgi:hypothetical protein
MEYDQVIQRLAACGLDCSRCADYKNGEIGELSAKLSGLLTGYDRLAKIKSERNPAFEGYDKFKEVLDIFAEPSCGGCRSDSVQCPITCHAKLCHKCVFLSIQTGVLVISGHHSYIIRPKAGNLISG